MVVRALARRGDRVLMLRRARGDSFGGCWETPGGKVDVHAGVCERPLDALAREFREESGLELLGTPELIATARRVSPKGKRVFDSRSSRRSPPASRRSQRSMTPRASPRPMTPPGS